MHSLLRTSQAHLGDGAPAVAALQLVLQGHPVGALVQLNRLGRHARRRQDLRLSERGGEQAGSEGLVAAPPLVNQRA